MRTSKRSTKGRTSSIASLLVIIAAVAFFITWELSFPPFTNVDEPLVLQDGVAISLYAKELLHGTVQNPVAFLHAFQQRTIGLVMNIYPPLVAGLYATVFLVTGPTILGAKLLHLLAMVGALLLLMSFMRRWCSEEEALLTALLLLTTFAFMRFENILMREAPYLFLLLLAAWLLDRYIDSRNAWWMTACCATLLLGSMTKDFFNFGIPALLVYFFLRTGKKAWSYVKGAMRWHALLAAALYLAISAAYYVTKLATSSKEKAFLFGGFDPVGGILFYAKALFLANPLLAIAFLVALPLAWRRKDRRPWNGFLLALLVTFALVMVSVHVKVDRYLFVFFPVAAAIAAQAWDALRTERARLAYAGILIVGGIIASGFGIAATMGEVQLLPDAGDEQVIADAVAADPDGTFLLLADYRFDVSFYLRKHGFEGTLIHAFFEENNAKELGWSRFRAFYGREPACEGMPTQECWDAFLDDADVTMVLVDARRINDTEIEAYAATYRTPGVPGATLISSSIPS